ncbi:MAG: DEAD/DEAH box helicase, partial [Candidatus Limnocylindrales bacterium]
MPADPLRDFGQPTADWFRSAFGQPTAVQAQGWPVIGQGEHALLTAPTGSGKTLAA